MCLAALFVFLLPTTYPLRVLGGEGGDFILQFVYEVCPIIRGRNLIKGAAN